MSFNFTSVNFNEALMGCCEFGKQWNLDGKSCSKIPPKFAKTLGGPSLCTTTATECCESTRAAFHCFYGYWDFNKLSQGLQKISFSKLVTFGNQHFWVEYTLLVLESTCFYESQSSTSCNDRKSCCQCCQIGRRQYAEYGSCDPGIALPEPCKSAYLSCCIESVDTSVPVIQAKFQIKTSFNYFSFTVKLKKTL